MAVVTGQCTEIPEKDERIFVMHIFAHTHNGRRLCKVPSLAICIPAAMPRKSQRNMKDGSGGEKKDARSERLLALDDLLQAELNKPYLAGKFVNSLKFKIGEPVLSMSHALWYDAFIVRHTKERQHPSSMKRDEDRVRDERVYQVPMCEIEFKGWPKKYNEVLPESELVSRDISHGNYEDVFGILLAHEWNESRREKLGLAMGEMGKGAFFLTDRDLALVERLWQNRNDTTVRFAEYAGRTAAQIKTEP